MRDKSRTKEISRAHYLRIKSDPARYEQLVQESTARRMAVRNWLAAYKLERGCKDCGYNGHSAALHLDHEGPKRGPISEMRSSVTRLQKEITDGACVVRCAICHAIRTWAQKNRIEYVPGTRQNIEDFQAGLEKHYNRAKKDRERKSCARPAKPRVSNVVPVSAAHKAHQCAACLKTIQVGERYVSVATKPWDHPDFRSVQRAWVNDKFCQPCYESQQALTDLEKVAA